MTGSAWKSLTGSLLRKRVFIRDSIIYIGYYPDTANFSQGHCVCVCVCLRACVRACVRVRSCEIPHNLMKAALN